jgi:signal transduction histidine kinase
MSKDRQDQLVADSEGRGALRRALLPAVAATLAALLVVTLTLFSRRIEDKARIILGDSMETIVRTAAGSIRLWRNDVQANLASVAAFPEVRKLVEEEAHGSHAMNGAQDKLSGLKELLSPLMMAHGYLAFAVFARGSQGQVEPLFAADPRDRDFHRHADDAIREALAGRSGIGRPFVVPSSTGDEAARGAAGERPALMIAAAPIFDKSGAPLAALVAYLEPTQTLTRLTREARIGNSGETYVLDDSGHMITTSRFEPDLERLSLDLNDVPGDFITLRDVGGNLLDGFRPTLPRSALPLTTMANEVAHHRSGSNLEGYRDYRGVMVVGAWSWDPDLAVGIATEVDRTEAYQPLRALTALVWTMIGAVVLALLTFWAISEDGRRMVRANMMLREVDKARKELLATIAHDLRSPLSALLLANELLLRTLPENFEFTEKRRRLLERSRAAGERMRRMVADLLDTTKLEAGTLRVEPRPCGLDQLLESVLQDIEPLVKERKLEFKLEQAEGLPELQADPDRVYQILSNLLGNAVKFTPSGGSVTLVIQRAMAGVQFSVRDTGPGISKEEIPYLFQRFWQNRKTEHFGTGLGLAITQELVRKHSGQIWVESEPGRGSTFSFTLPAAAPN